MNRHLDALDRLHEITCCLEAVSDLITPEPDLHAVNRDKMALLLTFLLTEQRRAYENLERAGFSKKVVEFKSS